jgi:hypothetical protein
MRNLPFLFGGNNVYYYYYYIIIIIIIRTVWYLKGSIPKFQQSIKRDRQQILSNSGLV